VVLDLLESSLAVSLLDESLLDESLFDESLLDVLAGSDDDFSALAALLYESLR
jgi:hypothetical protein